MGVVHGRKGVGVSFVEDHSPLPSPAVSAVMAAEQLLKTVPYPTVAEATRDRSGTTHAIRRNLDALFVQLELLRLNLQDVESGQKEEQWQGW